MSEFNRKGFTAKPVYTVETLDDGTKTRYKAVPVISKNYQKRRKIEKQNRRSGRRR